MLTKIIKKKIKKVGSIIKYPYQLKAGDLIIYKYTNKNEPSTIGVLLSINDEDNLVRIKWLQPGLFKLSDMMPIGYIICNFKVLG